MSGYRQSNFDPDAHQQPGRPLRPFNGVQWLGVALTILSMLVYGRHFAGELGWMPELKVRTLFVGLPLLILGTALINSRRQPGMLVGSEQLARNRRVLIITVAICAIILGLAAAVEFTGA